MKAEKSFAVGSRLVQKIATVLQSITEVNLGLLEIY